MIRIALSPLRPERFLLRQDYILGHTHILTYTVPRVVDGGSSQKITSSPTLPLMMNTDGLAG